ncbi:hypothetical protein J5N97_020939 [Dioscorea zingiberensis]|uniref:poly(A)-specific ribonuclease n=1 Tax=Dioscorea zingiberensis TaxID=325984 RepID=A0A9D5CHD7_9LILI|nr:hypothetical protein J5N97_020939 [Dioscorea zingiberensis]
MPLIAAHPIQKHDQVIIRHVWAHNVEEELALIASAMRHYPIISIDTEFPGVIFHSDKHYSALTVSERYSVMKLNVDALNLIQLGFTLSDPSGNLPDLGSGGLLLFAWEFNFNDFNFNSDLHSQDSINLLQSSGIDFERNRLEGIDSHWFACLLVNYGIVGARYNVNWVTFHGAYDFAYLVKILTGGSSLPESMETFFELVRVFFGDDWWDVKHIMKYCDTLYGGLETALKMQRLAGKRHQAGSDSLLTCQTFLKMMETFFPKESGKKHAGVLFGLEMQV